ncbi:hypothetical protein GCM10022421_08930 [Oceanisphaera sediminis]|uniref:Phage tail protein n=1 Tax=Oceanisphaera sediminis TaxID=981381 RepID=A0ABP7DH99_9GAMM
MIGVKYDIRMLQKLRQQFDQKDVNKALIWALDATTRKAATFISRDLRGTYAVSANQVKQHLKIKRVERDASRALLYTGKKLPLAQFAPRPKVVRVLATSSRGKPFKTKRKGVTLRVRKDAGRKLVKGGWHAKGHILRRADAADNRSDPRIQYGPSIPGMVAHPATIDQAQELVRRELPKEFSGRLEYILGKK